MVVGGGANGSCSPLTDDHVQQLLARGLTHATIEAAGLWSASAEQVADILGFNPQSGGIVIPYYHPFTGHVVLNRVRPDTPPLINGKAAKYLSPKGARNRLYFPPGSASWLNDTSISIGLTEGEFKVLWAYQAGLSYVGCVGVWGWRGRNERGETCPIADLDSINWKDRVVTITFDSDSATSPKVQDAQNALALEAYRRGTRDVYSTDLPPEQNGDKNGMDDFIHRYGVEAFLDLEGTEIPSPFPKIKLWTGPELLATSIERPPPIVKAWGIRRGGKVIFTGAGGKGKSTILLQVGCGLAAGKPLLGHTALEVASPQRVAVLMAEDPLSEIKFRWERQMAALGYNYEVAQRIAFLDSQEGKIMLTSKYARPALFNALRRHHADICILDPLVAVHDADENSNSAMRNVLDLLSPFQEETGCTFIVAHHEPKAPENNSAASRGASAIRDWCRTMLRLYSPKNSSDGTQRFQLDLDKANYGGTVWNLTLERAHDSYLFTPIAVEAAVIPLDIWELLGPDGGWFDDIQKQVMERFDVSKATAYRALKKAEELKIVEIGQRVNPESKRKKSYLTRGTGPEGKE